MWSLLKRYLRPEVHISDFGALREGSATLEGIVGTPEEPLASPFRSKVCVAYTYRVYRVVKARQGTMPSLVKDVHRYARFPVVLEGGEITAIPVNPGEDVEAAEHQSYQAAASEGVFVQEDVIPPGRKVGLEGMVLKQKEGWEFRFKQLHDLGSSGEPATSPQPRDRRRRRKQQRR